jgi:hypothetical protein
MPTIAQIDKTKAILLEHRARVTKYMTRYINSLADRAANHDDSKMDVEEFEIYSQVIDEFDKAPFGSEGYEQLRVKLGLALEHHFQVNRHHPEHFETGVNGMDLVDMLEMLADWKSASLNPHGGNGDLMKSISILAEKYHISPQLTQILINTAKDFGLM